MDYSLFVGGSRNSEVGCGKGGPWETGRPFCGALEVMVILISVILVLAVGVVE